MQHQLNQDPEHGCSPLFGKEGLHGAIFALTLHPYGYTFVGKGTTYKSAYEGKIYEHLKSLQGSAVPVYLGDIYLQKSVYYLRPDYVIIHMGLMAWGGEKVGTDILTGTAEVKRTRDEIRAAGIIQLDERDSNMLWNEEVGRVLYIDFGRAVVSPGYLKRKSSVLEEIERNVVDKKKDEKKDGRPVADRAATLGTAGSD